VLTGRRVAHGEAVARGIAAAGGDAAFKLCDVTQPESVEATVRQAIGRLGRLDILLNDAGGSGAAARSTSTSKTCNAPGEQPFYPFAGPHRGLRTGRSVSRRRVSAASATFCMVEPGKLEENCSIILQSSSSRFASLNASAVRRMIDSRAFSIQLNVGLFWNSHESASRVLISPKSIPNRSKVSRLRRDRWSRQTVSRKRELHPPIDCTQLTIPNSIKVFSPRQRLL
jgi:NAD(P)-dependent dehydrogenase (short-subunit alcohol dehydrogenase family)